MAVSATVGLADGIAGVLAEVGYTGVVVERLSQLTGGASRETWSAAITSHDGARTVVLRRDPPGHGEPDRMRAEAACLRAAAAAGVPVPELIAAGDDALGIDAPYLLTARVPGEAIARKIQRDSAFDAIRPHLAAEMGRVLGLIHRTPTDTLGMLSRRDPLDVIEETYLSFGEPRAAVETGLRWLRDHRPPARAQTLVHGDFRLGNLLIDDGGIEGVLDWELAHLGSPIEDLGWLCVRAWRFGRPEPVAGIGSREDLLDGYAAVTGSRPGLDDLHWWEVYGTLRWLVLSRFQAQRHLSGAEHSLELAAIGRRVCESEYDLLLALGLLDDVPPAAATPWSATVHGRPELTEILALIRETLGGEVLEALPADRGRERFQLKICLNLLGIADRELRTGPVDVGDEAALAAAIRTGSADYTDPGIRQAMSTAVLARLRVSNPRHVPQVT